jgi:hypothetical protein
MEQVALALNGLCRQWLDHRHGRETTEQISFLLRYRQRRNAAAKRSHQRQRTDSS